MKHLILPWREIEILDQQDIDVDNLHVKKRK